MSKKTGPETSVTFRPSRVFGMLGEIANEVTVFPTSVLVSRDGDVLYRRSFISMARRFESRIRLAKRLIWPKQVLLVGERSWCSEPERAYFIFHTTTPLTIWMPADDVRNYGECLFRRIQDVMLQGAFATFDLN